MGAASEHGVNFRQLFIQLFPIPLGETAGDNDGFQTALLVAFDFAELQNIFNGLGFGIVNEAAGVDNDGVGFVQIRRQGIPRFVQQVEHLLAVHQVFGAAERDQPEFFTHRNMYNLSFCSFKGQQPGSNSESDA